MKFPEQRPNMFELEELEPRMLLTADVAGVASAALSASFSLTADRLEVFEHHSASLAESSLTPLSSAPTAATLSSIFDVGNEGPLLSQTTSDGADPETVSLLDSTQNSLASNPMSEVRSETDSTSKNSQLPPAPAPSQPPSQPESKQDSNASRTLANVAHEATSAPTKGGFQSHEASAAGSQPDRVLTLSEQLIATLKAGNGPPVDLLQHSATRSYISNQLLDSSGLPASSVLSSPALSEPLLTPVTKTNALRTGLTALRDRLETNATTGSFADKQFPVLQSSTFSSLITASGLNAEVRSKFFQPIDTFLNANPGATAENLRDFLGTLDGLVPGSVSLHVVGTQITYDIHVKYSKQASVRINQAANFPNEGINQNLQGAGSVNVSLDLNLTFGVDELVSKSTGDSFVFRVNDLLYGVESDGVALVTMDGFSGTDPKGLLRVDTALEVDFVAPSGGPYATLTHLQGSGAAGLLTSLTPTGQVGADLPISNGVSLGNPSIVSFVGTKTVVVDADDAFVQPPSLSLVLQGQLTVADLVTLIGQITLRRSPVTPGPAPAVIPADATRVPLTGLSIFVGRGWGTANAQGVLVSSAEGGLILTGSGVAIDVQGRISAVGLSDLKLQGAARVRVNTTSSAVSEDIRPFGPDRLVGTLPPAAHIEFADATRLIEVTGTLRLSVADNFVVNGDFNIRSATTPTSDYELKIAVRNLELFMGASDGSTDAAGFRLNEGTLGLVYRKPQTGDATYALVATGRIALVGVDAVHFNGNTTLLYNNMGNPGPITISVPGAPNIVIDFSDSTKRGDRTNPYYCIQGAMLLSLDVLGVIQLGGNVAIERRNVSGGPPTTQTSEVTMRLDPVVFDVGESGITRGDSRYQSLLANLRSEIQRLEGEGYEVVGINAAVNGNISLLGGRFKNRDNATGTDTLKENRRQHVLDIDDELSADLSSGSDTISVTFEEGTLGEGPGFERQYQNANFSNIRVQVRKQIPSAPRVQYRIAATDVMLFMGDGDLKIVAGSSGGEVVSLADGAKGLKISSGTLAALIETTQNNPPSGASTSATVYAFDVRGSSELIGWPELKLSSAARLRVNTLGKDPVTNADRLFTETLNLCGVTTPSVIVTAGVDRAGTKDAPFVRLDASLELQIDRYFWLGGTVSFQRFTVPDETLADIRSLTHLNRDGTGDTLSLRPIEFTIGRSDISSIADDPDVDAAYRAEAYEHYQSLLGNLRQEIARVEAANPGYKVTKLEALVNGRISSFGGAYRNRDAETGQNELAERRRDRTVALDAALSRELGIEVVLTPDATIERGGATVRDQQANFSSIEITVRKPGPGRTEILIGGDQIRAFAGFVTSDPPNPFDPASRRVGVELTGGRFGLFLKVDRDPSTGTGSGSGSGSTPRKTKLALHAEGTAALVGITGDLRLLTSARVTVDLNTTGEAVDKNVEVANPITGVLLTTVHLFYVEDIERVGIDGTLGINGFTLNGKFFFERTGTGSGLPLNLRNDSGALLAEIRSDGTVLFPAFSGFDTSSGSVEDWVIQIKRIADWLEALRGSSFFNTNIPFTSKKLGDLFDAGQNYLNDFYSRVVRMEMEGLGAIDAGVKSTGQSSTDLKFYLTINGAVTAKLVTVSVADMADNAAPPSGKTAFEMLAEDINRAVQAALTGTEFAGLLQVGVRTRNVLARDGTSESRTMLLLTNVPGKLVNRVRITKFETNTALELLGFTTGQEGVEHPQPGAEEELLQFIRNNVPGASNIIPAPSPGPAALLQAAQMLNLAFNWSNTFSTTFGGDLSLFTNLGSLSGSGTLQVQTNIRLETSIGVDLTVVETPRMRNVALIPPPSNGRLTGRAQFAILLSGQRDAALGVGDRYLVTLEAGDTSTNTSVQDLADDLNRAFANAGKTGTPTEKLSQHMEARVVGNNLVFIVKTSDLGVVNSIEVQADPQDLSITEMGLPLAYRTRAKVKGIFLEGARITATFSLGAVDLAMTARLGGGEGLIAISTQGGTLTGTVEATLNLADPSNGSGRPRVFLSNLGADLERAVTYVRPELTTSAAILLQLNDLRVTTPGFANLIDGDRDQLEVFIPDITDLHVNDQPYDPATNNRGLFIRLPEFSALASFNCLTVVDLLGGLSRMASQLQSVSGFEFLRDPIPGVGISLGQILDFGTRLSEAVTGVLRGDAATLERMQADLESVLGLPSGSLKFYTDHTPNPTVDRTNPRVVFDPQGDLNGIAFTAVSPGPTYQPVRIKFVDDGRYGTGLDQAEAVYSVGDRVLTLYYNSTFTRAATVVQAVERLIHESGSRAPPVTASIDPATGGNGSGTISQTAVRLELTFNTVFRQTLPFYLRLKDWVDQLRDPRFDGAKALLGALAELVSIEASGQVEINAAVTFRLALGLDISNPCRPAAFLYDADYAGAGTNTGTGIFLTASVRGTNLSFKAGGLLGISVRDGTITFDGDGDPATRGAGQDATFALTLKKQNSSGRHYFFRDSLFELSNFDIVTRAGFSAVLPVYTLGAIALGSTSDGNSDGFPDNALALKIPSLSELLSGNTTNIRFAAPDVASLFRNLDVCALIRQTPVLLDGLDELLGKIENGLRNQVLNTNLPLVGDKLGAAANFISDFRTGLLASIRRTFAETGDPIGLIKKAIFDVLGPSGLDLLVKVNAQGELVDGSGTVIVPDSGDYLSRVVAITDFNDVQIDCSGGNIDFKLRLLKRADLVDTSANPIQFDIGIPGLGLAVDGNVKVSLGFDLRLYFGVSLSEGFYFRTDQTGRTSTGGSSLQPVDELRVFFRITLPDLKVQGRLFFLQLDVSDEADNRDAEGNPRRKTQFEGFFSIDIKDPTGSDGKLTVADLQRPGLQLGDVVSARLGAAAEIHLDLAISFGGSAQFPRLLAEFDLEWRWELGRETRGPAIAINHVQIDAGSFISNLLGPILQEIKKVTGPLDPVIKAITTPIPGISDLMGRPVTMLDLAEIFGYLSPSTRRFIEAVATIINLANNISISADARILIPLGSFNLTQDRRGNVQSQGRPDGVIPGQTMTDRVNAAAGSSSGSGPIGAIRDFFAGLEKIGFKFPILDISAIAQLFTGKAVSIVEYHMPVLELRATISQSFPVFGPLSVFFGGEIGMKLDLTFGYDTFGLQKFFSSTDKNPLDILDGFFVKDVNDRGEDIPELTLRGGIFAGASLNVGFAEAGVQGGLFAEVQFNLNDPDGDGRVRVSEIIANAKKDVRCIFDISGEVYIELKVFLRINLLFFSVKFDWVFAKFTLLKFEIVCPEPLFAHFTDGPNTATNPFDGIGGSGKLVLHMGPLANLRVIDDTTDGDEIFTLKHLEGDPSSPEGETVEVIFGGTKQTFRGVKSIVADGGIGNDTIDLSQVWAPAGVAGGGASPGDSFVGVVGGLGNDRILASRRGGRYSGGEGNDFIQGVVDGEGDIEFHGDAGDDELIGTNRIDRLFGEAGNDRIKGLLGNDLLFGGNDADLIQGDEGDDQIEGGDGRDLIYGGTGNDFVLAGSGDDEVYGEVGTDRLVGNAGNDFLDGGEDDDVLVGDEGVIVLSADRVQVTGIDGIGNDVLVGGGASDVLFGGGGNDWIFGGARFNNGILTPVAVDGADFIDGGDGDDHLFADDTGGGGASDFPGATLTGSSWLELNLNNIRDINERGVVGVKVELYDATLNVSRGFTFTDANGDYRFEGLAAGKYYLVFTAPASRDLNGVVRPEGALRWVLKDQGLDDQVDSDADVTTGQTAVWDLREGQTVQHVDGGLYGNQLVVNIDNPSIREGTGGFSDMVFTVTLSRAMNSRVLVCYKTLDQTAVEDADYIGADWTLTFEPGETTKTITLKVVADNMDEGAGETFGLQICDVLVGTSRDDIYITRTIGVGSIVDDDAPPVISVTDGRQILNQENGRLEFFIRLSNPSSETIRVRWLTNQVVGANGLLLPSSATEGVDYDAAGGELVFASGETEKRIEVITRQDALDEYDELLSVVLQLPQATPPSIASLGDREGLGTIIDDDATPTLRLTAIDRFVNEGHAGGTLVRLKVGLYDLGVPGGVLTASGRDVTVRYSTADGVAHAMETPTEAPDYQYAFGTLLFQPGETEKVFTVLVLGDVTVEPDEDFYVNLISSENGIIGNTQTTTNHAIITIRNDEVADPGPWYVQFGQSQYEVTEGEAIKITLHRPLGSSDPDVVLSITGGVARLGAGVAGGDFELDVALNNRRRYLVSFAENETVKEILLTAQTDRFFEGDEQVVLELSNPTGGPARGSITKSTVTIHDVQAAPTIRIINTSATEGPSAFATLLVIVQLPDDVTLGTDIQSSVRWRTRDGTAVAGGAEPDYVAADHPGVLGDLEALVFTTADFGGPDGNSLPQIVTRLLRVNIANDGIPESAELFYVDLIEARNIEITRATAEITIRDEDPIAASGYVYHDVNNNGRYDPDLDRRLPGVSVKVSDGLGGVRTVLTDAAGLWTANVPSGELTVEVLGITTLLPGAVNSTRNQPLTAPVDYRNGKVADVGFAVEARPGNVPGSTGSAPIYNNDTVFGGPGNDEIDGGGGDDWLVGGHWLGPGCACNGNPYNADILAQVSSTGGRRVLRWYINPASLGALGSLSGRVWLDFTNSTTLTSNGNGQRDAGETGVAGVQVNLFDETWNPVGTTFTDSTGAYRFESLSPCGYFVQFVLPDGRVFTRTSSGGPAIPGDLDSNASPDTGLTAAFSVQAGVETRNVDAGLLPVVSDLNGPWNLSFAQAVYSVLATDPAAVIRILRAIGSSDPDGTFRTLNGTAINPVDYDAIKRVLSLGDTETSLDISITIHDTGAKGAPRTVFLQLQNPTGGPVRGAIPRAVLLIFDKGCTDDDLIRGGDGNDTLLGDYGYVDFANPAAPRTVLLEGLGNDRLHGGAGNDSLFGEGGKDRLEGGTGDDQLDGGSGDDLYAMNVDEAAPGSTPIIQRDIIREGLQPLGGFDFLDFSLTSVPLTVDLSLTTEQSIAPTLRITLATGNVEGVLGGKGDDILLGNSSNNRLEGGDGNDVLEGRAGDDVLVGGRGSDVYRFDADSDLGRDELVEENNGLTEADRDRLDFTLTTTVGASVDLSLVAEQIVNARLRVILSNALGLEDLYGTALADVLKGNARDNVIWGQAGNDSLDGGAAGYDVLKEERAGNWSLQSGILRLVGTGEQDTFVAASFDEISLIGDDNANTLDASSFNGLVRLDGRGGNDILRGGSGTNYFTGGSGADQIVGGTGLDILTEQGDGDFVLTSSALVFRAAGSGVTETDTLTGMDRVSLTGGASGNLLDSTAFGGPVQLRGLGGNDRLFSGSGDDLLEGGAGDDELAGGGGNDHYLINLDEDAGSDVLTELPGDGNADLLDFSASTVLGVQIDLGLTALQNLTDGGNHRLTLDFNDIENVIGTELDDRLIGNELSNRLEGRGGADELTGRSGNDILDGGSGSKDRVVEFVSGDVVAQRDAVSGTGSLTFAGLNSAPGHTIGERDTLTGIEEATLTGNENVNLLDARTFQGSTVLAGGDGNDVLRGGSYNDVLSGGIGNDDLYGGDGDDRYLFNADSDLGDDRLFENVHTRFDSTLLRFINSSVDTLDFGDSSLGITVSLNLGVLQVVSPVLSIELRFETGTGTSPDFENVVGGAGDDRITGNALDNILDGGQGNDVLMDAGDPVSATTDLWIGGAGNDTYRFTSTATQRLIRILEDVGQGGVDTVDFGLLTTRVTVDLGEGHAQAVDAAARLRVEFLGCHGIENLIGTSQNDVLIGNATDNDIQGGGGADDIQGRRGNDVMDGGVGDDRLAGGRGNDRYRYVNVGTLGTDLIDEALGQGEDTLDATGLPGLDALPVLSQAGAPQRLSANARITLVRASTLERVVPDKLTAPAPAQTEEGHVPRLAVVTGSGFLSKYQGRSPPMNSAVLFSPGALRPAKPAEVFLPTSSSLITRIFGTTQAVSNSTQQASQSSPLRFKHLSVPQLGSTRNWVPTKYLSASVS